MRDPSVSRVYTIEYAYMIMVLLMTYSLSGVVVRAPRYARRAV